MVKGRGQQQQKGTSGGRAVVYGVGRGTKIPETLLIHLSHNTQFTTLVFNIFLWGSWFVMF